MSPIKKTLNKSPPLESKYHKLQQTYLYVNTQLISSQINNLRKDYSDLKVLVNTQFSLHSQLVTKDMNNLTNICKNFSSKISKVLSHQIEKKKEIYNSFINTTSNIRYYCRIRTPLTVGSKPKIYIQCNNDHKTVIIQNETITNKYEFNYVFNESSSQREIFNEIKPLLVSVIDGYNLTFLVFGEENSGKSYTMFGPPIRRGITYNSYTELFTLKKERIEYEDIKFTFSMLEIYNETIKDLLNPKLPIVKIQQQNSGNNNKLNLSSHENKEVKNADEMIKLMDIGNKNRNNELNNVSHLLIKIDIKNTNKFDKSTKESCLMFVDLASSNNIDYNGKNGIKLIECQSVNKSLNNLCDALKQFNNNSQDVKCYNSKLTEILKVYIYILCI